MRTNLYVQLDYDGYKELEEQLSNYKSMETTHSSVEGHYHKAFRLRVGDVTFEFQGPLVRKPMSIEPSAGELGCQRDLTTFTHIGECKGTCAQSQNR